MSIDGHSEDRGQAVTYVLAGATIVLFAGLYAVMMTPVDEILTAADDRCITEACKTGVTHADQAYTWLPLAVAFLVMVMLLSAAIWKSGARR